MKVDISKLMKFEICWFWNPMQYKHGPLVIHLRLVPLVDHEILEKHNKECLSN